MDWQMGNDQSDYGERDSRKKIMVVDDDPMLLRSIIGILERYYSISVATSGVQAMFLMGKKRPDLILLDYEMPVCDGKQTLEMIRSEKDLKDIPVIFLTGVTDRENIIAVLKLKPAGYLLKPVDSERLLDEISKILD